MAADAASVLITSAEDQQEKTQRKRSSSQLLDQSSSLVSHSRRKRYGTVGSNWRVNNSYILHQVAPTDTLQGIALKYQVPVSEIKRENCIFTGEAIHCFSQLKVPWMSGSQSPTPQGSPVFSRKAVTSSLERHSVLSVAAQTVSTDLEHSTEERETSRSQQGDSEEAGIRSMSSVLNAADFQIKASREFSEKLQARNAALKHVHGAHGNNSNDAMPLFKEPKPPKGHSFSLKLPSLPFRESWSPATNRERVEDEIFEL